MANIAQEAKALGAALAGKAPQAEGALGYFFKHSIEANGVGGKVFGAVIDALFLVPKAIFGALGKAGEGLGILTAKTTGAMVSGSTGAVLHVAQQPVVGAMKIARGAVNVVRNHPIATGAVALGGAGIAFASGARSKAESDTQQQLMSRATGGQYMNSVSPDEMAAMDARLKQGSGVNGSFADAARSSADQVAAPQV